MPLRPTLIASLFLLAVPGGATTTLGAQDVAVAASSDSATRDLARVLRGERRPVRLTTRGLGRLRGTVDAADSIDVTLRTWGGARVVALADVDTVWVRHGSAARVLGLVAAVPCALFGGLVGAAFASDPDSNGKPGDAPIGAVVGAVGGAVVCGLPSAALGSLIVRWRRVYVRGPSRAQATRRRDVTWVRVRA